MTPNREIQRANEERLSQYDRDMQAAKAAAAHALGIASARDHRVIAALDRIGDALDRIGDALDERVPHGHA